MRSDPPEVFSRSPRRHYQYPEAETGRISNRQDSNEQSTAKLSAREDLNIEGSLNWLHKNCFREIISIERNLEEKKVALGELSDFTLTQAWSIFTDSSISRLSVLDLQKGFEKLGIVCDEADCRLLLVRYDADEDMRLGFWEFCNILMPIEPTLREELERRASVEEMTEETGMALKTVFRHAIDSECMVESIR